MKRFAVITAAAAFAFAVNGAAYAQGQKTTTAAPGDAKTFITQMAAGGMAEVQLGRMASQRAANADVKAYGQMMVKDHTQADNELKQVASQMKVALPKQLDQKHRDLAARLSKLKGAAFDREYMNAMVADHEEVATQLRAWSGNASAANTTGSATVGTSGRAQGDGPVMQWAAKTLPAVEHHLEEARSLSQKVK